MSASFALTNSVTTGSIVWAINGIGLALLIPNAQSLIADYFRPVSRGKAFGALYLTGAIGGMLGSLYATNIGHFHSMFGVLEGWRVAFLSVAAISAVVGTLNLFFPVDPRFAVDNPQYTQDPDIFKQQPISFAPIMADMGSVLAVPSFALIVIQGIIGSAPWQALVWNTLYLQLLGFSDFHTSLIASLFLLGTAVGAGVDGVVGDWAATKLPNHGRILTAQFSVGMGVPMAGIVYKLLPVPVSMTPPSSSLLSIYSVAFFLFGTLISWSAPACTSPVFGEIVPAQQRTLVYSFDRAFEGALAATGAPIVGWLAERMGYDAGGKDAPDQDVDSATALGDAMLLCTAIPWALCALLCSGLHVTYKLDRVKAQVYQRARSGWFVSTSTLPIIDEEREEDAWQHEEALAAVGRSVRAPMPVAGGVSPARVGRSVSRSV